MDLYEKRTSALENQAKNMEASIKNIDIQMGQLAKASHQRPQGTLPSDTELNPKGKEVCNAITLRCGKELSGNKRREEKEASEEEVIEETTLVGEEPQDKEGSVRAQESKRKKGAPSPCDDSPYAPPPPFPQRLRPPDKKGVQFTRFLDIVKNVNVNVPLLDLVTAVPRYAKFLKDLIANKEQILQCEVQSRSPRKVKRGSIMNYRPNSKTLVAVWCPAQLVEDFLARLCVILELE